MARYYDDEEDRPQQTGAGVFKIPDRDFYRKNFCTFNSVTNFLENRKQTHHSTLSFPQPHYNSLVHINTPYGNPLNPADGVCMRFLKRGFTKPNRVPFNHAVWSADGRWLVLGTQLGDLALWEAEPLKVNKIISIPAHKEFYPDGERIKEHIPITAMNLKHHGNLLVTGDARGVIQYCDETFRNVFVTKHAHDAAVRGVSFSPLDSKLVSASDDSKVHIWSIGRDQPELTLQGHQAEIKSCEWHPYRSLIATGSRDTMIKLWDPKAGNSSNGTGGNGCVSTITAHKRQVNAIAWNQNGNWLASGSVDHLIKIYDIRMMKEMEVWRGQNSEVTRIAWHPVHESLLVSGGYNGTLAYWMYGLNGNTGILTSTPHSIIGEAHRQSIDMICWHPSGHLLATASHDAILKFWCREPPGSKMELSSMEPNLETAPTYMHGPLPIGSSYQQIRPGNAFQQQQQQQPAGGGAGGFAGEGGGAAGGGGVGGGGQFERRSFERGGGGGGEFGGRRPYNPDGSGGRGRGRGRGFYRGGGRGGEGGDGGGGGSGGGGRFNNNNSNNNDNNSYYGSGGGNDNASTSTTTEQHQRKRFRGGEN